MVSKYPNTLQDFIDSFPTEDACREYLALIRWGEGFVCPSCDHTQAWKQARHVLRCARCKRDVSVTAGTLFQDTHIPLRLWFQALWSVVSQKQGVSALGLSRILGIDRYETAWRMLKKIRRAMVRPDRERLSGIVEVDEILLGGKRKNHDGRTAVGKVLVLVAAEYKSNRTIGRIRMRIIPSASETSIFAALKTMVDPGSMIRTDGWAGYQNLPEQGYDHIPIKRKPSVPGDDPTPLIHRISSLLKRWLMGTHHGRVETTHLSSYLDEFVFRFNRRTSHSRGMLFYRLVEYMIVTKPR